MSIVGEQIELLAYEGIWSVAQIARTCHLFSVDCVLKSEKGAPTAIGIYLRVLSALQLDDILWLAKEDKLGKVCRLEFEDKEASF